jgi:hypothetical protein
MTAQHGEDQKTDSDAHHRSWFQHAGCGDPTRSKSAFGISALFGIDRIIEKIRRDLNAQ